MLLTFTLLSLLHFTSSVAGEDPWRFLVLADWHSAEPFVQHPILDVNDPPRQSGGGKKIKTFKHIKEKYGGELVLLPGDAESGKWYRPELLEELNVSTQEEAVREAGRRCYNSMKLVFKEGGYSKLLMAVGDHELGGNMWFLGLPKTSLVPTFRQIFYEQFNRDDQGEFLYQDPIGNADSRPFGTIFQRTSYAYRHKNILFVTVDAFTSRPYDYHDLERGRGGEGTITFIVTGKHLRWFKSVLSEARRDPGIKHIMVQTHLPILQPVRKIRCTGQYMDGAENSDFFKAMREYNVDVYWAGEVHANTATKDDKSNVLQVVSRGNGAQNIIVVDVSDEIINITQYNDVGTKPSHNRNYEFYGQVIVDKSGETTRIESTGSLELLNRKRAMLYFPLENTVKLSENPVLGLYHDDKDSTLMQRKVTILGTECWDSFPNMGAYGQSYDAQTGQVVLREGVIGKAAEFNLSSRVAIEAFGPHSGGVNVAYALWFKTQHAHRNQVLIHYGSHRSIKDDRYRNTVFTLSLDRGGVLALHANKNMTLTGIPADEGLNMADDEWHHAAIAMPRNSCRLSEVRMYIDGKEVETRVDGVDNYLFLDLAGSISVGGFGYSKPATYEKMLERHEAYVGLIDEVYVWAGTSLSSEQVAALAEKPFPAIFTLHQHYTCEGASFKKVKLSRSRCNEECLQSDSCRGYDITLNQHGMSICRIFQVQPRRGIWSDRHVCAVKK